MVNITTVIVSLVILIAIIVIQKTRTIKDLDRLHEINEDIKKKFRDYKVQAYNLAEHVMSHVKDRNEMIDESIKIINLLLEQSKENQELINSVIVDELINDLSIMIKKSNLSEDHDYHRSLAFLKSLKRQSDTINERIKYETSLISKLLTMSNKHMRDNIANMLLRHK